MPQIIKRIYSPRTEYELSIAWENIRLDRAQRIRDTDWTQTIDCPLSDEKKAEFAAYRQSLRDIPQTYPNPDDVVWPEKPTV